MSSKGILDTQYAVERKQKPELIFRYKTRARFVANCALKYLGRGQGLDILDLGAAEGLTMSEMDRLMPGSTIDGVEFSPELLERAEQMPSNLTLTAGDVTALPAEIKSKQYDIVSALALLEHLSNPIEAVCEAAEVLKPGGVFIASSPNPFWDDVSTKLGLLRDEQHETDMTEEMMIGLVHKAGLTSIRFERFMWSPVSILPYLHVPVPPGLSLSVDAAVQRLRVFDRLFVNQAVIAKKPDVA